MLNYFDNRSTNAAADPTQLLRLTPKNNAKKK